MKKKIVWLTSDCFVDCDFDKDILQDILKIYDIEWYILLPLEESRYKNYDFSPLKKLDGINIHLFEFLHRNGSIKRIFDYLRLFRNIKKEKYDIIYINCPPTPLLLPFIITLDSKKAIMTAHQGEVHKGFSNPWKHKIIRFFLYHKIPNINMFSLSQAALMAKHFPKATINTVNLSLKDFGKPNASVQKDRTHVIFSSFGTINYGKHIDLLIDAACNMYEQGVRNIRIKIFGQCDNWEFYKQKIRYPEIFECKIELIDNKEIPDLFCSSHFFVQPYRIVTQSGPLKIAFNYNVPVICSNLPGFRDEVKENINGLLFESENVDDLQNALLKAIDIVEKGEYNSLQERMKEYVVANYSPSRIADSYIKMFNKLTKKHEIYSNDRFTYSVLNSNRDFEHS